MDELITFIKKYITDDSQLLNVISKHTGSQEYKRLLEAYGVYMEKYGADYAKRVVQNYSMEFLSLAQCIEAFKEFI